MTNRRKYRSTSRYPYGDFPWEEGEYRGSGEPCDEVFDQNMEDFGSRHVPDERDVWGDE